MKTQKLALIALLALPLAAGAATTNDTTASTTSDTPNGVLGENYAGAFGTYHTYGYPNGSHTDGKSLGLDLNYNLYTGSTFGLDASASYEYARNATSGAENRFCTNAYTASLTGFAKVSQRFTPFVTATVYTDSTSGPYDPTNYDSTWFAARIGVETHLVDGWYVTPSVTLWNEFRSDYKASSACADWGIESGYWFTKYTLAYASVNYREMNGTDEAWFGTGIRVHF